MFESIFIPAYRRNWYDLPLYIRERINYPEHIDCLIKPWYNILMNTYQYSAFAGDIRIATGTLKEVLTDVHTYLNRDGEGRDDDIPILFFRNDTGVQTDFDLHGTLEDVLERALPPEPKKGPGRPRIGVQCGEVCLMPRHWEWLERQPKKASGTLRLLVEHAMKNMSPQDRERERVDAAQKFMWVAAGDRVGFEEASRALDARKWEVFRALVALWPEDIVVQLDEILQAETEDSPQL